MAQEPWQPLLDLLTTLRRAWPGGPWTWDHRFKCATSAIEDAALLPKARADVTALLPHAVDATSLATTTDELRALAQAKGGLRPGQEMFCSDPVGGMVLYLLWWPWNGGAYVSGRFGIANSDRPKELFPLVRAIFEIT